MGYTEKILDQIRGELAPTDKVLSAARARRDVVLGIGAGFPGGLRTYRSGSIAHGTANSDTDADCGVVLDRRSYPQLGPDGDDEGPQDVVGRMVRLLRTELPDEYPEAQIGTTKRAIQITFDEPVDGQDPSVDLIVALTRADKPGLWIPNLRSNEWDASDPERHTDLFTAKPASLRQVRARTTRLGKGWNGQFDPPGMCSFNVEVLAWSAVESEMTMATGLLETFRFGAKDLKRGLTRDPADISPPIKLAIERSEMVARLERAVAQLEEALDNDENEEAVTKALAWLFPEFVEPPEGSAKGRWADALRGGNAAISVGVGGLRLDRSGTALKDTRSFGGRREV